jgi:hypothetical protein
LLKAVIVERLGIRKIARSTNQWAIEAPHKQRNTTMSGINGVGAGHFHHHVQEAGPSAPTASTGEAQASSGSDANTLQALQNLVKQIETSANTQAIPAHQNW